MTKILIKRLSKEVSLPKYETSGSSGMDLAANIDAGIDLGPFDLCIMMCSGTIENDKSLTIQNIKSVHETSVHD